MCSHVRARAERVKDVESCKQDKKDHQHVSYIVHLVIHRSWIQMEILSREKDGHSMFKLIIQMIARMTINAGSGQTVPSKF